MNNSKLETLESKYIPASEEGSLTQAPSKIREMPGESTKPGPVRKAINHTGGKVKEKAGEVIDAAKETAGKKANSYLNEASDHARNISRATRETSTTLSESEPEFVTQGFDWLSRQIDSVANYLESKDAGEIVSDAKEFTRKRPALVIGSLAAAGFLAGRIMKASEPDNSSQEQS